MTWSIRRPRTSRTNLRERTDHTENTRELALERIQPNNADSERERVRLANESFVRRLKAALA